MRPDRIHFRKRYVSTSVWGISLAVLLLLGGIHTGLIVLVIRWNLSGFLSSAIVILYWVLVSLGFTVLTRWQMKRAYERPVKEIARFARKVAEGDFSVYLPTRHTADKYDFLDMLVLDLNKMVEDLGSIETLKTEFFSNVSHEIKTPLAVIQNTAQLLQGSRISDEERQRHIQTIIQASKRLSSLITNILKLSKLEKQAILPRPERYDLCRQLTDCALQFEQVWEEKDIEFECDMDDRVMICADESLMELVWTNLLSNAFKFTGAGGTVSLRQAVTQDEVLVCVSDTGCGMSADTLRRIFDKFYQGDTSHATEGNGLGLALVKRILQLMNSEITVESEAGKGSSFAVHIPITAMIEGATNDE